MSAHRLTVEPLTPERWSDLETLFGERGCWCMYYRVAGRDDPPPGVKRRDANRAAMQSLVRSGTVPGWVGYRDGEDPIDPRRSDADAFWFGTKSMYDAEGFVEVARRSPGRPVMRKPLRPTKG